MGWQSRQQFHDHDDPHDGSPAHRLLRRQNDSGLQEVAEDGEPVLQTAAAMAWIYSVLMLRIVEATRHIYMQVEAIREFESPAD